MPMKEKTPEIVEAIAGARQSPRLVARMPAQQLHSKRLAADWKASHHGLPELLWRELQAER